MKCVAVSMIGGVVIAAIMELVLFPAIYCVWRCLPSRRKTRNAPDHLGAVAREAELA